MSVTIPPLFSADEVSQRAQDNAMFLVLGNLAVLRQLGIDPHAWARAWGNLVASRWDSTIHPDLTDFARDMALSQRGFGAEVRSLNAGADHAEMEIVWPSDAMLAYFGLSRAEAIEPLMAIGSAFAEPLGFRCDWELHGDTVRIRYDRR